MTTDKIRNIAIIAHVDHGKTTLVDGLLKQSHTFRDNQAEMSQELIMDSGDQEKERGITITAKITAINYNDYRLNIIDTPGHADFSGEVERTINMADGCLLIVDAVEGPMPQTKFVLQKAFQANLVPIVIINKIDKGYDRLSEVEDEIADLFLELAEHENQLHYLTYYAIGRLEKAWAKLPTNIEESANLEPIFQAIVEHIPAPQVDEQGHFQFQISALSYDSFKGKYAIGRINRGQIKKADNVILISDNLQTKCRVDSIYQSQGLAKFEINQAIAGDIVYLTGLTNPKIGDTVCDPALIEKLPAINIEPPTLKIYLGPNTSPFKGQDSKFNTSRQLQDRLNLELETNVGLVYEPEGIGFSVSGRGELHLGVLITAMRREGYEFEVGTVTVVNKTENGKTLEPIEELLIEVPAEHLGAVQMELGSRQAILKEQFLSLKNVAKLVYTIPLKDAIGLRNSLLTATKGTVIINSLSAGYAEYRPKSNSKQRNGVLIAFETGVTTAYSLQNAEQRGLVFVGPGEKVYAGQIIGLNNRENDLEINVCKEKHLTNMRSSSSDGVIQLTPPINLSLEQSIEFIQNDELLEVTPNFLRLRKKELNPVYRKRQAK